MQNSAPALENSMAVPQEIKYRIVRDFSGGLWFNAAHSLQVQVQSLGRELRPWKTCVCLVAQLCLTFDPSNCSPLGSSVHRIFQARKLEWVAISSFRRSSWPRDQTSISCVFCIVGRSCTHWAIWEAQKLRPNLSLSLSLSLSLFILEHTYILELSYDLAFHFWASIQKYRKQKLRHVFVQLCL